MSSIGRKPLRHHAWLKLWVGAALSLSACHYTETSKWAACCNMVVDRGKGINTAPAKTIIDLLRQVDFDPDGQARAPINPKSSEKQDILSAMNRFMANQPKSRPSDYFLDFGMTCKPATSPTVDVTRCEVELAIQVKCYSTNESQPWGSPLPDELQNPLPALLYWRVDVSKSALLDTHIQVLPIPGGRLCHR